MSDKEKGMPYAPLTTHEAQEIKEAHLAFEGAGGNRGRHWSHEGFPGPAKRFTQLREVPKGEDGAVSVLATLLGYGDGAMGVSAPPWLQYQWAPAHDITERLDRIIEKGGSEYER